VNDGQNRPHADATDRPDVPPELKATEAKLAMLIPRDDRLQRDRLIFLAGQASVRGGVDRQKKHLARWVWPTSLAAMTTVAAALLVMLLARPESPVVERIVYVPAQPAPANASVGPDVAQGTSEPRAPVVTQTDASRHAMSSFRFVTTHAPRRQRLPAAGPQFRLFDHLLAEASRVQMNQGMSTGEYDDPVSRPVLSRQLLNELLEESRAADSPSDWPASQNPGAKT